MAHTSENTIVIFATDLRTGNTITVALKFIQHREYFDREIEMRKIDSTRRLDQRFVMPIVEQITLNTCASVQDSRLRGRFLLVMEKVREQQLVSVVSRIQLHSSGGLHPKFAARHSHVHSM